MNQQALRSGKFITAILVLVLGVIQCWAGLAGPAPRQAGQQPTVEEDNNSELKAGSSTVISRQITFGPALPSTNYFGQVVLKEPTWDRYLMYFSSSSTVAAGKPSNAIPGSPGTFNNRCQSWYADRIWLTWHFGDGKTPNGWNANDGYGNLPPLLMLSPSGPGESALIGDPFVVFWKKQWHMFYEGTDDCTGLNNRIFHATAPNWAGPWTKRGLVQGLYGNVAGSGLSWPTVLIDNDQLYLYFTDGSVRLMGARALDNSAQNFYMMNLDSSKPLNLQTNPKPITSEQVNRGQIIKVGQQYRLISDNFGRTSVKSAISATPFSFPPGTVLLNPQQSTPAWENNRVGLPSGLMINGEFRIYYTGEGSQGNGLGVTVIQ